MRVLDINAKRGEVGTSGAGTDHPGEGPCSVQSDESVS